MTVISTKNRLDDFDMCLAIAQSAIDTQMEYAWSTWKRRTGFKDTIELFKVEKGGQLVDSKFGLSATLAPLSVNLAVENGKFGQVQVNLRLLSGKVVYYDEVQEGPAEYPVKDWTISFLTDLDTTPVDLKALAQIDPAAGQIAADVIAQSGLPESVFSIEYLFLKFTQINLMLADNKDIKIPADVPGSARNRAMAALNQLLKGQMGDYILGSVVRRNRNQATPTFALTDFIFSVSANFTAPRASTLNYLGAFAGRAMPANSAAARAKLPDIWVRPEQIDGRESNVSGIMAISKSVFLEKYLMPIITNELNRVLGGTELKVTHDNEKAWAFKKAHTDNNHWQDLVDNVATRTMGYELTLQVRPSEGKIDISGRCSSGFHLDQKTLAGGGGLLYWGNLYKDGHSDITGSIDLTGSGAGARFNLEAKLSYQLSKPIVDVDEIGGEQKFEDAMGFLYGWFGDKTPHEWVTGEQKGTSDFMEAVLRDALARLDVNLQQHTFIPPGGGVFSFSNPRFSDATDLFFDVIYTAP
jgi:hypothetical protein